ncbi:wall-associated receptor kinase 2-like [Rutidosis leptorrhynchoides]|uniref:wall-associated receptor kinase 2-like n=1 Tax=Rutidosis leptorrhynchoides TaxID=125765 RepID=UPI003A99DB01
MKLMILSFVLKVMIVIVLLSRSSNTAAQSLPNCPDKCGNVTIPYPFGTTEDCYLSRSYYVNCTSLQIYNTSFQLSSVSLDGYMRGSLPMGYRCYNKKHAKTRWLEPEIMLSRFPVSSTHNLFTTVGCDARSSMKYINSENYITGCLSMTGCTGLTDGSCLGMGCSQVPVPYKVTSFRIHAQDNTKRYVGKWSYNKCVYAFVVEKHHYWFRETDLDTMVNRSFPVVLEWSLGSTSCVEAQKKNPETYLCKENSVCDDHTYTVDFIQSYHHQGYRCHCAQGYQGNPYLPNGCQGKIIIIVINL